ncbi:hypothetical protein CR532_00555 [Candidatus Borreliella tachyglossi]|uniref:Outer membrane protein n=1 Tax=Candidatus Borreliella tachyglossi TaxID=1964448 RepID=A0A2S1LW44_9SPIR|nr:hypothetical protein [Candidatus Borreliella tachyglossi]AWG42506.1 hypothetical protein CR532_00555 [Candidatus Borreliella tachyglossi]
MKFNITLILIMLATNSYSYNYAIKYKNDGVDKYHFESLNDGFGFAFSDFFDDLRSGSLIFTHESKYNFIINAEAHMLTFRGYQGTAENLIKRVDLLEIGFMYYFPFLIKSNTTYFGDIDIGLGIKNLIYGNWGGTLMQKVVHLTLRQFRPIPENYEKYNYIGFLSSAINYSYMRFLNFENYLDLSYFADYFFKTSIGLDFRNEAIGIETKLFYQIQNKINNIKTYAKVQEAESGFGIQYRIYSKNFFTTNNLNIHNFLDRENFLSVGGFGISLTQEYDNITENDLYTLNQNFAIGYEFMVPFQLRNLIYYKVMPAFKCYFAIATNYDINETEINSLTNKFSSGITYELFTKGLFTLYIGSGIYLSYNKDNKDIKAIYRPIKIKDTLQLGFEIEPGMLIEAFKYNKAIYNFKIFTKMNYSPMVYNIDAKALEKHTYTFNYFGIGVEVTT